MTPEDDEPLGLDVQEPADMVNRVMLNANACQLLGRIKGVRRSRGSGAFRQKMARNQAALDLLFKCEVPNGVILLFSHLLGGPVRKKHRSAFDQSCLLVAWYAAAWAEPNDRFEKATVSRVAKVYAAARRLPGDAERLGDSRSQVIALRMESAYRALVTRIHAAQGKSMFFN